MWFWIILLGIIFAVSWLLLVVVAINFSIAKKKAERSQAICGSEFMEIESERHAIKTEYEKNMKLLTPAMIMLSLTSLVMMCYAYFIYVSAVKKGQSFKNHIYVTENMIVLIVSVILFLACLSLWLSEIVALSKLSRQIKLQSTISASWMKKITQFNIALSTLNVGLVCILLGVNIYLHKTMNTDKPDIQWIPYISLIVFGIIILITKVLLGFNVQSLTNKAIVPYTQKTSEVDTKITQMLRKPQTRLPVQAYLRNNIHRMDPNLQVDPTLNAESNDPFIRKYYLYIEHRGGRETVPGLDSTKRISLQTLKSLLGRFYTYNFPNANNTTEAELSAIPAITDDALKTKPIYYTPQAKAIREWIYNVMLGTRNQEDIRFNKREFLAAVARYSPQLDNAFGTVLLNMNQSDAEINVAYFKANINAGNAPALPQDSLQDVVSTMLLHTDAYNGVEVDMNDLLLNLAANTTINSVVKDAINKELALYQDSSVMSSLQSKMRELRNLSPVMKSETNKLIRQIFWTTMVIVVITGFALFHIVYNKYKDHNAIMTMMIALFMILLIVGFAIYHWIAGVTQL